MTNTVVEGYRLSPQQARVWALGQAAPELPLGAACALRLRGALDPDALAKAVARVVGRHEILRTTFRASAEGGEPVQVIGGTGDTTLEFRDLAGLPERERAALEAAGWAASIGPRPGAEGAALRAVLFRRGADDHVLHLALPALCADDVTLDLLVAELGAEYAGRADEGGEADEPMQYVDYSEWLHETVESDAAGEGRSFWARHPSADDGPLPELWPAPPARAAAGTAVEHRLLDAEAAARLDGAAAAHGTDAEAWLLAAWRVVLHRHLGGEAFAVGVAADGRAFDEMRGSPGPFSRYLPLRGGVDAAPLAALAAGTGDALRQARAWQAFHAWPAADARLRFGFDWARRAESGRWGAVAWRVERRWHQADAFSLRLSAERTDEGVRLALWYDAAAVPAEGAARLLRRLAALLQAAADDPAAPADTLPLLDARERAEALGGTGTLPVFPADEPLHRRFERQAARTPHAVAVSFAGQSVTYGELDARANRLGRRLRARGVGPEARVGLCLERGIEAVVGILGILKAGGAYVPLDPAYPAERLAYVLEDAGIRVLLASSAVRDRIPPSSAEIVSLDAEWERIADEDGGALEGGAGADSLAYVIYTSGSTGRPKGVLVTHAHVARLFAATEASFGFGADDVWTLFHSLAFDFSVWELWGALLYGGRLVVVPFAVSRDPAAFRALLAREGVTVLNQTPSAFRQLIAADEGADEPLALRWVVFGGEALEPAALRPWMDRHGEARPRLVNMYGITETTVHVTHRPLTRADAERGGRSPVGVPIADLAVYVLDGRLNPAAPGLAGEMFVGGAGVARGYLGRPALTAERFVPDPFAAEPGARMYRSGDRARRIPGGELEFLGRADEQVKIRGFRIEPGEIEAALRAHPAVADAAVIAREDAPGEKRLVAYVVPADGMHAAPAELRAHAAASLPEYMVPAACVVLPRLPLTTNGKLDRRALPAPAAGEDDGEAYVAPRTPAEEVLAAVWAEVLGRERVGIDDNFFAVGGDSILSVRVAVLARERGLPLEIADLFAHPTVRALAERVAQGGSEAEALRAILNRDRRPFDLVPAEDRARMPDDAEDAYPLAALQAGMLYHLALTADGAPAYHNVDSFQFRGRFDEAAFRAALARAAARQENLRTSIHLNGFSEPLQVVHRHAEIPLAVTDIRHLDDAAQEALLAEIRRRELHTPFDLERAPLLRMHVHLRADDRFHLTLAENHAINDGWSLTSLFAELLEDQAALLRGEPLPERPVPAVRFRDFVELERAVMQAGESRRFWAGHLDGFVPGRLPRTTGAARDGGGRGTERVEVPLSPEVRAGLASLARAQGVPLKSVLLAAHFKVMSLSTGERDVVTGLTTNGRPEVAGGTDVRGLFLNTVPLRLRLGEGSWESLVREVFRAEAQVLPHRRYPLAHLQREHGPERLFETAFNLVRFHALAGVLSSGIADILSGHDVADTDHTLAAAAGLHPVTAEIMFFGFNYQRGELTREEARDIADRYRRVLQAMAADPSARHDRLDTLSAAERALVVDACNRTEVDHPLDGVHRRFEARAEQSPDAVAVVRGDESLTYGELDARANRLARHLVRLGVGAETRVGICLERGAELIACMLAVLKAGGAYVPLDPAYPAERLSFVLADSAAAVLLTREALRGAVTPPAGVTVVELDTQADRIAREAADGVDGGAGVRSLAYVIYTSGSTGTPKGVAVEHGALGNVCAWHARALGITAADRASQLISAGFDGSVLEIWPTLASGGCVQVVPDAVRTDPPALRDWLVRHGTTISTTPASLAEPLLALEWPRTAALRWLLSGADRLRSRPAAGAPFALTNNYGPTETTSIVTSVVVAAEGQGAPSIGGPGDNNRVYVLDAAMRPVPAGVPGELYVGGAQVARGYLGRPALTAERFVPDAFGAPGARLYRTGDRVRWVESAEVRECVSAEGTDETTPALTHSRTHALEFLGRLDAQVKVRGFRVEPGEIEAALRQAGVAECAVLAREDVPGETRLVAYVAGGAGVDELRESLRRTLPEHMVPAAFVVLDHLPLTTNGKVDRKALPAPDYSLAASRYVAPRTPVEEVLAGIWAQVLRLERVGVEDGFFALGGDSILSMRVVSRARQAGVQITPAQMFAHPTIRDLAAAAGAVQGALRAEQGRVEGAVPLTPVQAAFVEHGQPVPAHFNQAVLMEVDASVADGVLEGALAAVVEHHDALRLRLRRTADGWEQWHGDDAGIVLERVDLSALPAAERDRAQGAEAQARQAGLDLERGPVGRAVLFDRGEQGRVLLLVLHHLVVDGVSWRILREDLERACGQLGAGGTVELGPKSTSFRQWAETLRTYAGSDALGAQAAHWRAQGAEGVAPLPADGAGEHTLAAARTVQVSLDADETRALLQEVPAALRTQINDVLLCALADAVSRWTGGTRVRLALEGHGREEEAGAGLELTRTVGWFTSVYPVVLDLAGAEGPGGCLGRVKEQLRAVPVRGVGYGVLRYLSPDAEVRAALAAQPEPEITFNYLGQFDQGRAPDGLLRFAGGPQGNPIAGENRRRCALDVDGAVAGGCLRMGWTYTEGVHRAETIQALADDYLRALRALIAHARTPGAAAYTPSDFPLARLAQAQLDAVVAGRAVEDLYPLSPLQEGLLFHAQAGGGTQAYQVQVAQRLEGPLDPGLLRRAWAEVGRRHPILRTSFAWQGLPRPLQRVEASAEVPWREEDWRGMTADAQEAALDAFLAEERARGLALDRAPLLRCALFRLGDERWCIAWSSHHLLLDGWSSSRLMGEVMRLYAAWSGGASVDLPPVRPFRDYVAWLESRDPGTDERFWRGVLAGFAAPTPLPVDRPAAPGAELLHAREERVLPPALTQRLEAAARARRVTVNTLLQGAWALLLSRYGGGDDVVFGSTVSGRPAELEGMEEMVGLFINTLPVRVAVREEAPLGAWLAELQRAQAEARDHAYASLVAVQGWSQVPRGTALFDSLVVFENFPVERSGMSDAGAPASRLRLTGGRAVEWTSYPLSLVAAPGAELQLALSYDARRFDPDTIGRILEHVTRLLEQMAEEGDRPLHALTLLDDAERRRILEAWNPPFVESGGAEATLHRRFEEQAERTPGAVAVRFKAESLTYAELNARANRLARHLARLGVGPEVRVGLCLERGMEMIAAILGVLKAGGAYVPLEPGYPAERLAYMLADSAVPVLVTQESVRTALPAPPEGVRVVSLDGADAAALAAESAENPESGAGPDALAYVIYTSGSTGRPKGVLVEHRQVARLFSATDAWFGFGAGDVWTLFHSYAFDFSVWEIWGALLHGGRLVVVPWEVSRNPDAFHALLREEGVTVLNQTPSAFRPLIETDAEHGGELALRTVVFGGEALDPATLRGWVERRGTERPRLVNMYGITETTVHVTYRPLDRGDVFEGEGSPIGVPIPDLQLYVLDAARQPVPAGIPGELFVGGAGVARGYLNRPELTAERFVANPFGAGRLYRTGDRARWRTVRECESAKVRKWDGSADSRDNASAHALTHSRTSALPFALEYLGRADEQVKIRGFRIEPGEIEAVLRRHAAVRDCTVVAREHAAGDRRLVAYVVGGAEVDALRAHLRRHLPEYMVPASFVALGALPLTANGKVDRRALPAPEYGGAEYLAPRTQAEETLAAVWAQVLEVERVGAHDHFFERGGHSLLIMRLIAEVRAAFGVELPVRAVFALPTLEAMAAEVERLILEEILAMSDDEALAGQAAGG